MNVSPLTMRRLKNFRANKRGYYAALVFSILFLISVFAEFIANDKPILVVFNGQIHFPVFEKKFLKHIMAVNLKLKLITKTLS